MHSDIQKNTESQIRDPPTSGFFVNSAWHVIPWNLFEVLLTCGRNAPPVNADRDALICTEAGLAMMLEDCPIAAISMQMQ